MGDRRPTVTLVIPARFGSTRFPGKPLLPLLGKPLIQHVYERAAACRAVAEVLVATDDARIQTAVERFGGRVVMMTDPYRTGTDRVAGIARDHPGDYFVNLQGDEIIEQPELLSDLIEPCLTEGCGIGTLKRRIDATEDLVNPAVVKVVTDAAGFALYFSRAPIPVVRDAATPTVAAGLHFIHLGLYMYRKDMLLQLASLPTGVLENAEKLEQLRALEQGLRIRVWETRYASLRIDTPADVAAVVERLHQVDQRKCDPRFGMIS